MKHYSSRNAPTGIQRKDSRVGIQWVAEVERYKVRKVFLTYILNTFERKRDRETAPIC